METTWTALSEVLPKGPRDPGPEKQVAHSWAPHRAQCALISLLSPELILHPSHEVRVCRRENHGSVQWEAGLGLNPTYVTSEAGASRRCDTLSHTAVAHKGMQWRPTLCPCDSSMHHTGNVLAQPGAWNSPGKKYLYLFSQH